MIKIIKMEVKKCVNCPYFGSGGFIFDSHDKCYKSDKKIKNPLIIQKWCEFENKKENEQK